ncbi:MAG: DNRLRE domain-containing protein [Candidatus Margulisbacteria bacterium]|nr:DNRLRE domain-containing protein [Candidatus Margulisiibacteriota bacterium]
MTIRALGISALVLGLLAGTLVFFGCGDIPEEDGETVRTLSISPSYATVEVNSVCTYSATALYTDGTSAVIQPNWSVSNAVGTITSAGLFTATREAGGLVVAYYKSRTAYATVIVTGHHEPGGLTTIEVAPSAVDTRIGKQEMFAAQGYTNSGETVAITPTWSISGDAIGVLSSSGTVATLEINAEGSAWVYCTSGEVYGTSEVKVEGYFVELTAEVDTYVDSVDHAAHGSDLVLIAGRITTPAERLYEAYIKFDTAFIPLGSTVQSSTLKLYATSTDGTAMNIGRIASVWNESTTWESRPSLGSFIGNKTFAAGDNTMDITDTVQYWLDTSNYGVMIYQATTGVGSVNLISEDDTSVDERRPKLEIEYTLP